MKLYCLQNKSAVENALTNGMTFSEGFIYETIGRENLNAFRCASGAKELLNREGSIIEIEVGSESVSVAEGAFEYDNVKFTNSLKPLREYRLGMYIDPVFFVKSEVQAENCVEFDENNACIKIFESPDKFYIQCLYEKLNERYSNFELYAVRSCLETLSSCGAMKRSENGNYIFFEDVQTGEIIPVCKKYKE